MHFVYRYFNCKGELIYIGLTEVSLESRLSKRKIGEVDWYDEIDRIEYVSFENSKEMIFCEFYLISKLKPKYNTKDTEIDLNYSVDYFDNLAWLSWNKEDYLKEIQKKKGSRQSKINLKLWSNKRYKEDRIKKMNRHPYVLTMPDGKKIEFESRKEVELYFRKEFGMSPRVIADLTKKKIYNTHYSKWKHLEGMSLERIERYTGK